MAINVSDQVLMLVGVVVLAMCISFDVFKAYQRGAKWLPGNAVVIYALCVQLIGYLDAQNVSIQSRDKDHQLEVLIAKQLSIDSSRLVLFVFVGYLLPGLASTQGFWPNLAALCTSLFTHVAIELYVALQSRANEKDKVVKGQSGIWLIVTRCAMLESILFFSFLVVLAVSRGRFIRDNLGSRIPVALSREDNKESPQNDNETISWETCESEMLKSWIVTRVSQPEYVFSRSIMSVAVGCVVTFYVAFIGAKVIFLRSQLPGPFPLFTLQSIFIIVGWFFVFYRCFVGYSNLNRGPLLVCPNLIELEDFLFNILSVCRSRPLVILFSDEIIKRVTNVVLRSLLACVFRLFALIFFSLPLVCILVLLLMGVIGISFVTTPILSFGLSLLMLGKRFYPAPPENEEDFQRYREALQWVCMPREDAKSLWVENKSSFNHIKKGIQQAYDRGKACEELQRVVGSRLAENIPPSEAVKELLEPLESVKKYFPLLNDSFRRITARFLRRMLLLMDDFVSQDQHFVGDVETAYKETEELMDLLDCPFNVGISVDTFNVSNLEAFALRTAAKYPTHPWEDVRFDYREPPTVANARKSIEKLYKDAEKKLTLLKLVGDDNAQAVDTDWMVAAQPYAIYKVCKIILDHSHYHVEDLVDDIFNMFADIIASCVRDSPKTLVEHSRKWAAEFREDKISAAIQLAGFACGVIDKAKMQHLQLPV